MSAYESWREMPRWKKRLNGWFCYQASAWLALVFPEIVDRAMYRTLCKQFDAKGGQQA